MITAEQLQAITTKCPPELLADHVAGLNAAVTEAELDSLVRCAMFLGQWLWETNGLSTLVETADGSAYEGRRSLGNTQPGDGPRFKGRGVPMLTGRYNYQRFADYSGADVVSQPELLERPQLAWRAASWYWRLHRCNEAADARMYRAITKAINGDDTDGAPSYHTHRRDWYLRALEVLALRVPLT